jgi:hypothetical protein
MEAHAQIEGRSSTPGGESAYPVLHEIKRQANRSWVHLRRGCLDLVGDPVEHSTPGVASSSRAFARKAAAATGKSYRELITWLDESRLGTWR